MNKKIEVKYKEKIISGILLTETNEIMTIKLDSGYNSILNKSEVEILSLGKRDELVNKKNLKLEKYKSNSLLNVKILHTGGTIASKVDYSTGGVSSKFTPEELLNLYPDLLDKVNLSAEMVGNLFSEDLRFSHYNLLLDKIKEAINEKFDGVIISHGTDTMHYTSAALQYACKNLPIPVILVGAQRSSDRPSSDAYFNLSAAIDFIIYNSKQNKKFLRVGACMHESISDDNFLILDSINLKKMHSSRRDAFKQINYKPFARVSGDSVEILRYDLLSFEVGDKFNFQKYNENLKIGFFKTHPNLYPEEIKNLAIYDAVIIEGTGLGHLGINQVDASTKIHLDNLEELKILSEKIPVIMGVQTVYGRTNLNVYSTGRHIQDLGIYGNEMNLITEDLFIRTAFCLSSDKVNFNKIWNDNLEGFGVINSKSNDI